MAFLKATTRVIMDSLHFSRDLPSHSASEQLMCIVFCTTKASWSWYTVLNAPTSCFFFLMGEGKKRGEVQLVVEEVGLFTGETTSYPR